VRSWRLDAVGQVTGDVRVPGDKSISHRALMLGALAQGDTEIRGLLRGEDCLATLAILRAVGVHIEDSPEVVVVRGRGAEAFREAETVLDAGNSGTTLRLLAGVLAGRPWLSVLTGDASLRRRPMGRVVEPLRRMGAAIAGRAGGEYAPLAIRGATLRGITWRTPVASAQVKSAVLLAGLQAWGPTAVIEPLTSRDHTERMLGAFGAAVEVEGTTVRVRGPATLQAAAVAVPGDFSSAAFLIVAAAARPGSDVRLRDVGINPTRTGLLGVLARMGADLTLERRREVAGEPVADLRVRGMRLRSAQVAAHEIPGLVDEVPALAVAAALAEGDTVIEGAGELRLKEVDRLAALAGEMTALGAAVQADGDVLRIRGGRALTGAEVQSRGDHRMAMSLAVAGLFADGETLVRDVACVETSFPGFAELLRAVAPGCNIREVME
jgi:3-phosphoshikimate 1-carboxyvinyltransferase